MSRVYTQVVYDTPGLRGRDLASRDESQEGKRETSCQRTCFRHVLFWPNANCLMLQKLWFLAGFFFADGGDNLFGINHFE